MNTSKHWLFYIYSVLIFLPAIYRLYLPQDVGDYAYYVFAFLVPLVAFFVTTITSTIRVKILLVLLSILIVLSWSWLLSSGNELSSAIIFHGFKVYMIPVLMLLLGYHLGLTVTGKTYIRTLLIILAAHFIFSLLFYFDVLSNPMYDEYSGRFKENWVATVGGVKAFTGLTLSKFDLAYQVGFVLVGLLMMRRYFSNCRLEYLLCIVLGVILIVFTYNKTILVVLLLTLSALIFRSTKSRSTALAYITLATVIAVLAYGSFLFLAGEVNLTDVYKFLSPQTFWSRLVGWEELFHFEPANVLSGYGAGYFDQSKTILDNQFLYTYLELGVVGAITYFIVLFYIMYQFSQKDALAKLYIVLLLLVFIVGDILNALSVMYVVGLFFAQANRFLGSRYLTFHSEGQQHISRQSIPR